ncbi:toll/interleukin-1 receptor domain-containing protein [Pseudorhodoferax sp. Leaf267]|uniref:toll/interleukin-1 receptor domain-containing protein n=1 Tax=Pseudorhodoferax sp. Leaf267 TaxID=1736316 RepID=UPI0006FAB6AA|nr:toll/interleukin-1 receptor domain-containing protein [Pseudorhodoferax sp. Leaf267]KQP15050.1 hypothetical protein ASF43_13500 [Pseudorhodoferax sp. Leaf267]
MPEPDTRPVTLFYSYAHEDEVLRKELEKHLKLLERKGLIRPWHDRQIRPGQEWAQAIDESLESAELVLLLVSADFMNSDYIFGVELKRALERHAQQSCVAVPIVVRAVDLEGAPFMHLQGLPTDLKPVASWASQDEAWTNVAKGLRVTVEWIRGRRPPAAVSAPAPRRRRGPAQAGAVQADGLLDEVVAGVVQQIDTAERSRSGHAVDQALRPQLAEETRALIDVRDAKRVLWVDDRPDNNRGEMAVLAKLQIEVVAVRSTAEAMARIDADAAAGERFDLVLTDWSRADDAEPAALTLLQALRAERHTMPVVVYHGEFRPERRAAVAARCTAAGALGEAVVPTELMRLVHEAMAG